MGRKTRVVLGAWAADVAIVASRSAAEEALARRGPAMDADLLRGDGKGDVVEGHGCALPDGKGLPGG